MLVMNDAGADGGTSYDVDVETEGRGLLPTGQRLIRTRYGSEELLHDKSKRVEWTTLN